MRARRRCDARVLARATEDPLGALVYALPMRRRLVGALGLLLLSGCGDGDATRADAAPADAGVDSATIAAAPIAPTLTPCAAGWREVVSAEGVTACEPWPEGGRQACADFETHLPGEPGCAPIGTACPGGDFAEDLPTDSPIVYVLASAAAGGDGSLARPYASLRTAISRAASTRAVVAIGRGRYTPWLQLADGVTLWGACPEQTVLAGDVETGSVLAMAGVSATLRNLSIDHPGAAAVGALGAGAEVRLEGVVVRASFGAAVNAVDGGHIAMNRVLVTGTLPTADGSGPAIAVDTASTMDLQRVALEDSVTMGAYIRDVGTAITIEDSVIADVAARGRLQPGGVQVGRGASLVLRRSVIERATDVGLIASGAGTTVELSDCVIRDGQPTGADTGGWGVSVAVGATVTMQRVLIERNRDVGVLVDSAGTALMAQDLVVRDTAGAAPGAEQGRALGVQLGATLVGQRVVLERSGDVGLVVMDPGTTIEIDDLVVRDVESHQGDATFGRGVLVQSASAVLRRVLVERTRDVGVLALADGAVVDATDVVVRETRLRGCVDTTCAEAGFGHGAGAIEGATMTMTRFVVTGSAACGILLADRAEVDLADGVISGNPIGVCVQIDGYDVARLSQRVALEDNGSNLQATSLPVPGALGAL